MISLRSLFFLFVSLFSFITANAQNDFCNAASAIVGDAPNQFRNIRGNVIKARGTAIFWECGITVPGTISSRFVSSNGLFYEGALFQTKNKDEVKTVYDKYKSLLKDCFSSRQYKMYLQDNFYPGLEDYKKLAFMPLLQDDKKPGLPPPHITMEATYNKTVGYYTVVMYIFEH
jgi:hypothetical protein